jgi:hypothetical protein
MTACTFAARFRPCFVTAGWPFFLTTLPNPCQLKAASPFGRKSQIQLPAIDSGREIRPH